MKTLKTRVQQLDARDVAMLMGFNYRDTSFGNSGEIREMINEMLIEKFENGEIDEIELIIIESGN